VPGGDIAALREAMQRLLADAELRRTLAASAARIAGQRFSVAAAGQATVELYDELTRSSGHAAAEQRPQDA
jgi:glycosyltransferase involved in cell wall biosynthesis